MEKIYIKKSFIKNKDTRTYIMSNGLIVEKLDSNFIEIFSYNPNHKYNCKLISYSRTSLNDFEMVEILDFLSNNWNETPVQITLDEENRKWTAPVDFTIDTLSNGIPRKIYLLDSDPKEEYYIDFEQYETHVQYDSQENDYSHEILQEQMYA